MTEYDLFILLFNYLFMHLFINSLIHFLDFQFIDLIMYLLIHLLIYLFSIMYIYNILSITINDKELYLTHDQCCYWTSFHNRIYSPEKFGLSVDGGIQQAIWVVTPSKDPRMKSMLFAGMPNLCF